MARIRSIHPGLFSDPEFAGLNDAAQIFYLGLLTEADDNGIFEWKPATLRIRLRPCKDGAIEPLLSELQAADKVRPYETGGRMYGAIRNFRKFQRPKSPKSWHPIPDNFRNYVGLTDATSEIHPQMEDEGGRVEEEGGVKKEKMIPRRARKTKMLANKSRLPDDWKPTLEGLEYAKQQGCPDAADTAERFRLYHLSKGTLHINWTAAWQLWCRNEQNFSRPQATTQNRFSSPQATHADGDGQWGARMRGWHQSKFWKPYEWGPEPGNERCLVPPHLLRDAA
jgi:hypothetical protein